MTRYNPHKPTFAFNTDEVDVNAYTSTLRGTPKEEEKAKDEKEPVDKELLERIKTSSSLRDMSLGEMQLDKMRDDLRKQGVNPVSTEYVKGATDRNYKLRESFGNAGITIDDNDYIDLTQPITNAGIWAKRIDKLVASGLAEEHKDAGGRRIGISLKNDDDIAPHIDRAYITTKLPDTMSDVAQSDYFRELTSNVIEQLPKNDKGQILYSGVPYQWAELYEAFYPVVAEKAHNRALEDNKDYYNWSFENAMGMTYDEWYKTYADKRISEIEQKVIELRDAVAEEAAQIAEGRGREVALSSGTLVPVSVLGWASKEGARMEASKQFDDVLESIDTFRNNNFASGFNEGFDWLDVLSFGIADLGTSYSQLQLIEKAKRGESLSNSESKVLELLQITQEFEGIKKALGWERTLRSSVGSGVGSTVAAAPSFAIGMAGVSKVGTIVKLTANIAENASKKAAMKQIGKNFFHNAVVSYARGASVGAFMPSTYTTGLKELQEQYTFNSDGTIKFEPKSKSLAFLGGYIDTMNEYASETFGSTLGEIIAYGARTFGRVTHLNKVVDTIIDFRDTKLGNAIDEVLSYIPIEDEEKEAGLRRALRGMIVPNAELDGEKKELMRMLGVQDGYFAEAGSEVFGDFMSQVMRDVVGAKTDYSDFKDSTYWGTQLLVAVLYGGSMNTLGRIKEGVSDYQQIVDLGKHNKQILDKIENKELRNKVLAAVAEGSIEDMSAQLADIEWEKYHATDRAKVVDYVRNEMMIQTIAGKVEDNGRIEAFVNDVAKLSGVTYQGAGNMIIEVTSDGRTYYLIDGKEADKSEGSMLSCVDKETGETKAILSSKAEMVSARYYNEVVEGMYKERFSANTEATRLSSLQSAYDQMDRPTAEIARDMMQRYDITPPAEGDVVTLADGRQVKVTQDLEDGKYVVRLEGPEPKLFTIPFYSIRSNNPLTAEAQRVIIEGRVMDSANKASDVATAAVEEGVITNETISQAPEGIAPTTETANAETEVAQAQMEEQIANDTLDMTSVPTDADGDVDYDAIDDPAQYAQVYAHEAGNKAQARVEVEELKQKTLESAAKLEELSKNEITASAKRKKLKEAKKLRVRAAFYDNVLSELEEMEEDYTSVVKNEYSQQVAEPTLRILDAMAKKLGIKVRFVDEVNGGKANAQITKDGYVEIAFNRRDKSITFLMGHEFTHRMQDLSPAQYAEFKQMVRDFVDEEAWSNELNRLKSIYAIQGIAIEDSALEDEITADMAGALVEQRDAFLDYLEGKKNDRTFLDKVVDFLKDMASIFNGVGDTDREGQILSLVNGVNSLIEASEKTQAVRVDETEIEASATRLREQGGIVDSERGDVRYSIADVLTGDQREQAIADLMRVTGRSRRTVLNYLKAEESLANIILSGDNKAFLDIQVDESVPSIWNNSDYPQGTVEFSNICRKRLPFTMIYQRLQKDFPNTVFDASSLESIRQTLIANGEEVACGLCFVEDRRQLLGEIGSGFINALSGKEVELNEKQREAISRLQESGDTYIPNLYELITLDGMKMLRKDHPEVANAFVAYNNARGMQAGRLFQAYSAYHRDILNYDAKKVAKINNAGGLRIFSFSDFEAHHLIDLVQVLTDCAAKGIKVQGYTKVPQFAKAVKDTKMKVNRSLIAKAKGVVDADYIPQEGESVSPNVVNGKRLLFDTIEGIDVNSPDFFDSTDSKSVGNILVGINDEHIRIAMLDPFVDYIIGFHTGLSEAIREQKGIADWTNYKYQQLEKILKDDKLVNADKHGINIYTEVLTPEIKTERQFVREYLKVCEEKGWIPKYHRFLNKSKSGKFIYTKGYYKLLLDFKMFDKNGKILPQEVVVPVFDNEVNKQILEDYVAEEKSKAPNDELYGKVVDAMVERGTLTEEQVAEATGVNKPKFSLITPEMDASYMDAVERGDMATAQVGEAMGARYSMSSPEETAYSNARYSIQETDPVILDALNNGATMKVYRAMQVIDGELYPPMSAKVDGKLRNPIKIGVWERAEERPDLADEKGNFKLDKGNKTSLKARYNPYIHTSLTPLNDQFSSAQDRPNLVTVEVEVPVSELTSGYKAEKAKDAVGKLEWKAGVVQGQLTGTRTVILSRWDRPIRIVPDSEVAQRIVEMFGDTKVVMPSNVVTPSLRRELEGLGVEFRETDNQGKPRYSLITPEMDASYMDAVERGDMATAQQMVMEAAKLAMPNTKVVDENGNPKVVYHQTNHSVYINRETGRNWDELDWRERMVWDERDDWDEYWEERDFNTFSRVNARTTNELDGFFFAPEYDEYHEYGNRTIEAFLNIENPASSKDYHIDASKTNAGRDERIRMQNEGYDGVINEGDGAIYEYIAFSPSQIKSADPVTYDDAGNVIPLSERFNPRKEDIRYSIIGEIGATNLETYGNYGSPTFNLEIARELEAQGKSAKDIRLATNWERGKDGKWRYEIMDGKYNHPADDDITAKKYRLADVLDNPDLYKAYPYLKDMEVIYDQKLKYAGAYNGKNIKIKPVENVAEMESTLTHEVQHAIQHAEMFARGGVVNSIAKELETEGKQLAEEFRNVRSINVIRKGHLLYQIARKAWDTVKEDARASEAYRKLAGEVEARNVQKRHSMSEDERLRTLLSATEDVARKDQEVIFRENGAASVDTRYSINEDMSSEEEYKASLLEEAMRMEREAAKDGVDIAQEIADRTGWVHLADGNWEYYGEGKLVITDKASAERAAFRWLESKKAIKKARIRKIYYPLIKDAEEENAKAQLEYERDAALAEVDAEYKDIFEDFDNDPDKYVREYQESESYNANLDMYVGSLSKARKKVEKFERDAKRRKLSDEEKMAAMRAVKTAIAKELRDGLGRFTRKYDIQRMMDAVNDARTPYAMLKAIDKAMESLFEIKWRREYARMQSLIKAKLTYGVTTTDPSTFLNTFVSDHKITAADARKIMNDYWRGTKANGVSVAKYIDDTTRQTIEFISQFAEYAEASARFSDIETAKVGVFASKLREKLEDYKNLKDYKLSVALANDAVRKAVIDAVDILELYWKAQELQLSLNDDKHLRDISALELKTKEITEQLREVNQQIKDLAEGEVVVTASGIKDKDMLRKELQERYNVLLAERAEAYAEMYNAMPDIIKLMQDANRAVESLLRTGKVNLSIERVKRKEHEKELINDTLADLASPASPFKHIFDLRANRGTKRVKAFIGSSIGAPLGSMEYMLRTIGRNAPLGEGRLYNRFAYALQQAYDNIFTSVEDRKKALDDKCNLLFGEDYRVVQKEAESTKVMTLTYTSAIQNEDGGWDAIEKTSDIYVTQAMYIIATWNQADGIKALERQGFSEEVIDNMREALDAIDPRWNELADWVVNTYLPEGREKYNRVHREIFGTSMSIVPNYFPIKRAKEKIQKEEDVSSADADLLPSSVVGSIKERTSNVVPIDLDTSFFEALNENITVMEAWAEMADIIEDINAILSNGSIKTTMNDISPSLFSDFKKAAQVATLNYIGKTPGIDKNLGTILNRLWAGSKIAFRLSTAFKQLSSAVLFSGYSADPKFQAMLLWKYISGVGKMPVGILNSIMDGTSILTGDTFDRIDIMTNIEWAKENMPSFAKRWNEGVTGIEIMSRTTSGSTSWKQRTWAVKFDDAVKNVTKFGMKPNAFIDAFTSAAGARAVYDYELEQLQKAGYAKEEAHTLAIIRAEMAFNTTQQSSEGLYISPMQNDRSLLATSLSTFMNAPYAMFRNTVIGLKEIFRNAKKELKEIESMEFKRAMEIAKVRIDKQIAEEIANGMYSEGEDADKKREELIEDAKEYMMPRAKMVAKKKRKEAKVKAYIMVALNGYMGQLLFNLMGKLPDLIFGDDDEEKKKSITDMALHSIWEAPLSMMPAGSYVTSFVNGYNASLFPAVDEFAKEMQFVVKELRDDGVSPEVIDTVVKMLSRMSIGVNIDTWANIALAVDSMIEDGMSAEAILKFINAPESQIRNYVLQRRKGETSKEYGERVMRFYSILDTPIFEDYFYVEGENMNKRSNDEVPRGMSQKEMNRIKIEDSFRRSVILRNGGGTQLAEIENARKAYKKLKREGYGDMPDFQKKVLSKLTRDIKDGEFILMRTVDETKYYNILMQVKELQDEYIMLYEQFK